MIHQILTPFLNTLTLDDKHSLLNRDNLTQPIHIQLSQKQETFPHFFFFFSEFLKSVLNFKYSAKKDDHHS